MPVPESKNQLPDLLRRMPKAELHIHIEGSLEPELIFELAQKNGVALSYASVEELREAYSFTDLQSFLDLYYAGASVLLTEADFYAMAMAYFRRAANDNPADAQDGALFQLAFVGDRWAGAADVYGRPGAW